MTTEMNTHNFSLPDGFTADDIPVLIGKGGHNMKTCIRNMYNSGCTNPNFSFSEEDLSVNIKYDTEEQLGLMKNELNSYLTYYSQNKDNFRPRSRRQHEGQREGQQRRRDTRPRTRNFKNHVVIDISRGEVSSFIGEGGCNIKRLLSHIETTLNLDKKLQLHLHYEEDLVYMTVTLFEQHANMRTCVTVENQIHEWVSTNRESLKRSEIDTATTV
tara:strand:- start:167 stop:811 length:645 start_codon:yes stop_codon:yes gene_type:complete